ncbi:MFS transporter [Streptomyces sp. NPDC052727]|uniref:MFS transporter n=1 Tax=Streptomyces sp. NPDC052727 TaxID=3154854 RepID=UPI00343DC87E
MMIGAPVMSMATQRLPCRSALVAALLVFAAGHVVGALSSNLTPALIGRFAAALGNGTFWAVGAVVATAAAGPAASTRAMGVMVGGITLADIVGVPLGTAAGQLSGWQAPFWMLAALAVVAAGRGGLPAARRHHPRRHLPTRRDGRAQASPLVAGLPGHRAHPGRHHGRLQLCRPAAGRPTSVVSDAHALPATPGAAPEGRDAAARRVPAAGAGPRVPARAVRVSRRREGRRGRRRPAAPMPSRPLPAPRRATPRQGPRTGRTVGAAGSPRGSPVAPDNRGVPPSNG